MNFSLKHFFEKYNRQTNRFIEITIGILTWASITAPLWASYFIPEAMAYFILIMAVYWFYKSSTSAFYLILGYRRLRQYEKTDWLEKAKSTASWDKVLHLVIIPNYKEKQEKLEKTLEYLAAQTLPAKQLAVVLAMEKREGKEAVQKASRLSKKFHSRFRFLWATYHPILPDEVAGKSSNEAYAAKVAKKKLVNELGFDIDYITVTSCDADALFHPQYFSCLTYKFLCSPSRFRHFWQAAILEYSNIWRTTLPVRLVSSISSVFKIGHLMQTNEITPYSTYSTSLKMVDEIGYWDVDVIPEDWHLFFKSFFALRGEIEVEAIHLPVLIDAIEGESLLDSLKNRYMQNRRHAWGVTDIPYIIKNWFIHREIPFWKKTYRMLKAVEVHYIWPTNWFVLTLGTNLPPFINPFFKETVLGFNFSIYVRNILTFCLIFTAVFIVIDHLVKPKRPTHIGLFQFLISNTQWALMPVITLFLSALPGLDAHTRLMLGKKIDYKVTKKL